MAGFQDIGSSDLDRASVSQTRGRLAAKYPAGSQEQRDYIAKQGEEETKERGGGALALSQYRPGRFAAIQSQTIRDAKRGYPSMKE